MSKAFPIAIVVVLTLVGSLFFVLNKHSDDIPSTTLLSDRGADPALQSSDWKTYTNEKKQFTLRYPASYSIRDDQTSDDWFQAILEKEAEQHIEIYGEKTQGYCYENLCSITPKGTVNFNGINWDYIGSSTHCHVDAGCETNNAIYRTTKGDYTYYLIFSIPEEVEPVLKTAKFI